MPHQTKRKERKPFYLKRFKSLIILLTLIILLPGYFWIIRPQYNSYQKDKKLFEQYQQQQDINIKQIKNYRQTVSLYESFDIEQENKVNLVLPSDMDEADLFVNIEGLVEAADLTLDNITITPITPADQKISNPQNQLTPAAGAGQMEISPNKELNSALIDLDLSDVSYTKIKKLLSLIEVNLRLLDVDSFDFNAQEGTLNLSIKTYYLEE
jgi:hypothetical protein